METSGLWSMGATRHKLSQVTVQQYDRLKTKTAIRDMSESRASGCPAVNGQAHASTADGLTKVEKSHKSSSLTGCQS